MKYKELDHDGRDGEAWVGFCNNTGLAWLKLLKPGFRHCFAVVRISGQWLVYDPLSHHTRLDLAGSDDAVLDYLAERGCRLVPVRLNPPEPRPVPWRPFTCVEAVKRLIGLRAGGVLTPWQLYKHLYIWKTQGEKNIPTHRKKSLTF